MFFSAGKIQIIETTGVKLARGMSGIWDPQKTVTEKEGAAEGIRLNAVPHSRGGILDRNLERGGRGREGDRRGKVSCRMKQLSLPGIHSQVQTFSFISG